MVTKVVTGWSRFRPLSIVEKRKDEVFEQKHPAASRNRQMGSVSRSRRSDNRRKGESCALRWSDFDEAKSTIAVSHAIGVGPGGIYFKEPKTSESARTIPLTKHTAMLLSDMKASSQWMCKRLKVQFSDAYILGTQVEDSQPYHPTRLGKDFAAFCKMNNFDCTFHDLRHTFATYLIGSVTDVRTVSSYLGHSSVSMTLNVYADVDPEAKQRAVGKIEEAFDDAMSVFQRESAARLEEIQEEMAQIERAERKRNDEPMPQLSVNAIPFTIKELEETLNVLKAEG